MNALLRRLTTSIRIVRPIAAVACRPWYGAQPYNNRSGSPDEEGDHISYNGKKNWAPHQGDTKFEVSRYQQTFIELSNIGQGGFGTVFLCRHKIDLQLYAVKKIRTYRNTWESFILSKMDHPHIIKFYDSWFESGVLHIQMEYCPSSLEEYLKKECVIERSMADRILMQLLEALAYLSEQRVMHRDICPVNILMDHNTNVKLADFGLGKSLKNCDEESRVSEAEGHTQYMAPELKPDELISEAVDIYSLGLVYFMMLLHTHVWAKNSCMEGKLRKFRKNRQIPTCMRGSSDKDAIALIRKMTSSKPWERPSAAKILEAMRAEEDFADYEWGEAHSPARERYLNRKQDKFGRK